MIEAILAAAQHPWAPWTVLAGACSILVGEAWRVSGQVFWGDMFADETED